MEVSSIKTISIICSHSQGIIETNSHNLNNFCIKLGSSAIQKLFKFVAPIVFRVCHYLGGDMGGVRSRPKATKCDKGKGGQNCRYLE